MKKPRLKQYFIPWIGVFGVILFLGLSSGCAEVGAKELPIPATIHDLLSQPEQFDGQRVFVSGRVRLMKIEIGRRGSEYLGMVLEEPVPQTVDGPSVRVFSMTFPKVGTGNKISVQGTYHREGRFGGWPYDDFIEADAIIRDK